MYIYALLVFYCCFTSLDICNCCNPVLLTHIRLAPLHEPSHVCLLIHVGAAQARTLGRQERPVRGALVLAAVQVREMHAARASYDARLPNLVSVRMTEEDARREYM
jgi:hypothetical protein